MCVCSMFNGTSIFNSRQQKRHVHQQRKAKMSIKKNHNNNNEHDMTTVPARKEQQRKVIRSFDTLILEPTLVAIHSYEIILN